MPSSVDLPRIAAAMARLDDLPAAFADRDVVDANLATAAGYAAGTPIRIATKSVRVPALIERALAHPGVNGLMCATAAEAAWWAERRPGTDLLIAYPDVEPHALARCAAAVAEGATIRFMADCPAHLTALDVAGRAAGAVLDVCLDLDLSVAVGPVWFGVRRSPLRDAGAALAMAAEVRRRPHVRLVGLMGYEAQLAGLQDRPAGGSAKAAAIRLLKRRTAPAVAARRADVVGALTAAGIELALVNGGGSGSVPQTAAEAAVTEVAVGSALLCPALFDGYDAVRYRPAAGYALRVTRQPTAGVVTCHGGGWAASGAAGADRLPVPWHPVGAALLPTEGAGEVQTPIRLPDGVALQVGDAVLLRHAKAGELAERVDRIHLFAGGDLLEAVPTYRAEGIRLG